MAKGENIFKRKDGRWEARYIKGYELSGKIKYGFCYGKTYREAKEKVTKCKAALVSGKPVPSANSRRRFSFYCDEWLRLRKPKVKESTYIKYDTALIKHIKPKLGAASRWALRPVLSTALQKNCSLRRNWLLRQCMMCLLCCTES